MTRLVALTNSPRMRVMVASRSWNKESDVCACLYKWRRSLSLMVDKVVLATTVAPAMMMSETKVDMDTETIVKERENVEVE